MSEDKSQKIKQIHDMIANHKRTIINTRQPVQPAGHDNKDQDISKVMQNDLGKPYSPDFKS